MLIDHQNILARFRSHLEWATELDVATAWATSHEGLRLLKQRHGCLKVRAVVGLWGNQTDPAALRMLVKLGKLRLADGGRRFHPKVYVFRGSGKSVAWIGSANFTAGGFATNEEAVFETSETKSVEKWFDRLWRACGRLGVAAIDDYESEWRNNPPSPLPLPRRRRVDTPRRLLRQVRGWDSYVAAVEQSDLWWSRHRSWSVLGELNSWHRTIEVLHDIATQGDWDVLNDYDRQRLLGITVASGWALLGGMRPRAKATVFGRNRQRIHRIIRNTAAADDSAFPDLAFEAYAKLRNIPGVGEGIATRLLSLARPDRFVSVNDGSRAGLAAYSGFAASTLGSVRNYRRLLEWIYTREWFAEGEPHGQRERTIWWMRAALLDCFVYMD